MQVLGDPAHADAADADKMNRPDIDGKLAHSSAKRFVFVVIRFL
jgi:hypothetical protein